MRPSRPTAILIALAVGVLVVAGLIVHGVGGGVMLGVVVAVLVFMSSATWASLPSRGRVARGLVIGAVSGIAVFKLTGHG